MAEEKVYDTDKILKIIADLPLSWYEKRYPDTASLQHWGTNVTINGEAINGFYIDLSLSEAQIVTGGFGKSLGQIVKEIIIQPLLNGYHTEWFNGKCAWVMWDCDYDRTEKESDDEWNATIADIMVNYAVRVATSGWSAILAAFAKQDHYWHGNEAEFWEKAKARMDKFGSAEYVPENIESAISWQHEQEKERSE